MVSHKNQRLRILESICSKNVSFLLKVIKIKTKGLFLFCKSVDILIRIIGNKVTQSPVFKNGAFK